MKRKIRLYVYYVRKYSFSQRTVNDWGKLSADWGKLSADCVHSGSINMFKNKINNYLVSRFQFRIQFCRMQFQLKFQFQLWQFQFNSNSNYGNSNSNYANSNSFAIQCIFQWWQFQFNYNSNDGNSNSIPIPELELAINSNSGADLTPALLASEIQLFKNGILEVKAGFPSHFVWMPII